MENVGGCMDFRTEEKKIRKTVREMDRVDPCWRWDVASISKYAIGIRWNYLVYHGDPFPGFTVRWLTESGKLAVYDENGSPITEKLRDTSSLQSTMLSILVFADQNY